MKIAMFSDCYLDFTGGIVTVMDAQKKALEDLGHEVYIFTTGYPHGRKLLAGLRERKIFVVPSCKVFFWKLSPISRRPGVIRKWLLRVHPELAEFDVFYTHYEAGCSIAGILLGRELGIPVVQMMHGREDMGETNIIPLGLRTFVAVFLNWFHSWFIPHKVKIRRDGYLANSLAKAKMWEIMINHANAADVVVTPSKQFGTKLNHYGVSREIVVVPNGLADKWFPKEVEVRKLNAKANMACGARKVNKKVVFKAGEKKVDGRPLKIIWHSRVSAEKRIMPFLKALSLVPAGSWTLDVFGGGGDAFRARKFARRHGMRGVKFHGNTKFETLYKHLLEADLDVLVSYGFDTFGMTLIEAEAVGVPVLICDPDLLEVIPEGGVAIAAGPSVGQMAEAITRLTEEPERIEEMSKVMASHREEVLMSRRIGGLLEVFEKVIKNNK